MLHQFLGRYVQHHRDGFSSVIRHPSRSQNQFHESRRSQSDQSGILLVTSAHNTSIKMLRLFVLNCMLIFCAATIGGTNSSFQDDCLEDVSSIRHGRLGKSMYMRLLYSLLDGRIDTSIQNEKLSLRARSIFNLYACDGGRSCLVDPSIPISTNDDQQLLCQNMELALQDLLTSS